jgi:ribose transport system substrate-binding protein
MRFTTLVITVALAAIALVGCSGGSSEQPAGEPSASGSGTQSGSKLRVAVIPKGQTHDFWKSVHAGAEKAAAELGNVEIIWKGPEK